MLQWRLSISKIKPLPLLHPSRKPLNKQKGPQAFEISYSLQDPSLEAAAGFESVADQCYSIESLDTTQTGRRILPQFLTFLLIAPCPKNDRIDLIDADNGIVKVSFGEPGNVDQLVSNGGESPLQLFTAF